MTGGLTNPETEHKDRKQESEKKVSLIYNTESGDCFAYGQVESIFPALSTDSKNTLSYDDIVEYINPMDMPLRRRHIHNAIHSVREGSESMPYKASFRISARNDDTKDWHWIEEQGVVFKDPETGTIKTHSIWTLKKGSGLMSPLTPDSPVKNGHEKKLERQFPGLHFEREKNRQEMIIAIENWYSSETSNLLDKGYFLAVGLEGLSLINQAYGSEFTDNIIVEAQKKLENILNEAICVRRISGNTFGLFVSGQIWRPMRAMAGHIIASFFEQAFHHENEKLHIAVSVGGIVFKKNLESPANVIAKAEKALQLATEQGRGSFIQYKPDLDDPQYSTHSLLKAGEVFMDAFHENRLKLAYQPIVNVRDNSVSFYECLLRIVDPEGHLISAGTFIPALEKLGMMKIVDQFSIQQGIQELLSMDDINFSVNVTNWTLTDDEWLENVVEMLKGREEIAKRLVIEITENSVMRDIDKTARHINILRDLGCRIALDDFGAGHTNYAQLSRLNIDVVKIDKSFIQEAHKKNNKLFIQTLSKLASGMNIQTVGEGAEDQDAVRMLTDDGIHQIQGYIHGMPNIDRKWLLEDFKSRGNL